LKTNAPGSSNVMLLPQRTGLSSRQPVCISTPEGRRHKKATACPIPLMGIKQNRFRPLLLACFGIERAGNPRTQNTFLRINQLASFVW
jgi:hypothetical protein